VFSLLNGGHAGFYVRDIPKDADHGDMLGTNAFQIKDPYIGRFFCDICGSDHIYDLTLNKTDSGKWNLSIRKYLLADCSHTLPQEFKDSG
jgi:hypothetical protein